MVASSAMFVVVLGATIFYGLGTIFTPIREEYGWSSAATAAAFSVRSQGTGIAAPFVGIAITRIGPRLTYLIGIILTAAGLVMLSYINGIATFYGAMFLISVGGSACGGQVGLVVTATWFRRRRATAMSLLTIGGGLSGLLVVPMALLIDAIGWREALRLIAVVIVVVGMVPVSNSRFRPDDHPEPIDGRPRPEGESEADEARADWGLSTGAAVRTRAFAFLSIAMTAVSFGTTALVVHQIPFLEAAGIGSTTAAALVTVYTVTSTFGRIGFGMLGDRIPKRATMAICMALIALGLLLLPLVHTTVQAAAVLMIIAPGFGGNIPLRSAMLADYFGTRNFGTISGIGVFLQTLGAFAGPLAVGAAVDATGSYTVGWWITAICVAVAIPCVLLARPPIPEATRAPRELPMMVD